jgi:hypothetical protein
MNKNPAPHDAYASKPISPLMAEYVEWLKIETGYDVDPLSVQLSGVLRGTFQKSPQHQARLAAAAERLAAEEMNRAERKAVREAKAIAPKVEKPAPAKKPVSE